jgi:hypothetical protein
MRDAVLYCVLSAEPCLNLTSTNKGKANPRTGHEGPKGE